MSSLTGTLTLVRLALRRDRIRMPIWVLLLGAIPPLVIVPAFVELLPTQEQLVSFAALVNANPAFVAMFGRAPGPNLGGLVVWRSAPFAVVVGLVSLLTVIRHTRTEEEAGRHELLGSTVVGRHAPLAAALTVTVAANLVLMAVLAGGMVAQGQPASGSIAFGLAYGGTGIVFAALGAVCAQVTEGAGPARGIGVAALGASFVLRLTGDVAGDGTLRVLSWLSPIGWSQRLQPYGDERWWTLLLMGGLAVALVVSAVALSARRDAGAGLVRPRPGPGSASPMLRSPLALAGRLHRGMIIGWVAGFATMGAFLGAVADGFRELLADTPELEEIFMRLGGADVLIDAYLASMMGILALVASGYAIQAGLRLRTEEAAMRAEPLLAAPVSRARWAAGHVTFAMLGPAVALVAAGLTAGVAFGVVSGDLGRQVPRVLAGTLVQLPAVWVLAGIAVAVFGLLPRYVAVSWGVLGLFLFLGQLGSVLQLDQWALNLSPYTHVPAIPFADQTAVPLVWLAAAAAALTAAGVAGFRRRDIETP